MRHTHFNLNTDLNQKDKRLKRRNLKKKAMLRSALFWDIPQRIVVIPCRRFETTYSPIFKGQEIPKCIVPKLQATWCHRRPQILPTSRQRRP